MNINLFNELNKFNNVIFDELSHSYHIGSKKLISATGIIKNLHDEYDTLYWSAYKAIQRNGFEVKSKLRKDGLITILSDNINVHYTSIPLKYITGHTPASIQEEWTYKSEKSTYLGSCVHDYIELFYAKKTYIPPKSNHNKTIFFSDIEERYNASIARFHKFYEKTKHILIPIYSEFVVGELKSGVGGMIDQLFWNLKTSKLEVWDWKTNEEISVSNTFQNLYSPFDFLEDTSLSKYSIQLNIYKRLIERNTDIVMGRCYVVHLGGDTDNFKIYPCYELDSHIDIIINNQCESETP